MQIILSLTLKITFATDKMNEMARQEIIGMIKQLLLEADLPGELDIFLSNPNLSISEIQDLLNKLMLNPKTASALQVSTFFQDNELSTVLKCLYFQCRGEWLSYLTLKR